MALDEKQRRNQYIFALIEALEKSGGYSQTRAAELIQEEATIVRACFDRGDSPVFVAGRLYERANLRVIGRR